MGMHRRNWRSYIHASDEKPRLSWELVKRVLAYAKPYHWQIVGSLIAILIYTGVGLLSPLILRHLIDYAIPEQDIDRLILAAVGLLILPIISGAFQIITRRLTSQVGEGVIYDLRVSLYEHLQRMSLRFFTHHPSLITHHPSRKPFSPAVLSVKLCLIKVGVKPV